MFGIKALRQRVWCLEQAAEGFKHRLDDAEAKREDDTRGAQLAAAGCVDIPAAKKLWPESVGYFEDCFYGKPIDRLKRHHPALFKKK